MIGGRLSKWTISYFAAALAWLLIAEGLMVAGFGFPSADIGAADTLVVVHMVGIGWLSLVMCGALLQFVPVLVARPLYAERWALPAFVLLCCGLAVLLLGFLALGGRIPAFLTLLPVGAVLLIAGFALIAGNLGMTLWLSRPLIPSAWFISVGLLSLCAAITFGGIFALALSGRAAGSLFQKMLAFGVPLHAIAGLGGWLTLTAMGVSYRLLAMFMLAPDTDAHHCRATLLAGAAALAIAVAGGTVAILTAAGLDLMLSLAALSGLLTLLLYGRDVLVLYRARKRRALELNTRMAAWSFASLAAVVVLGEALIATASFTRHAGAFVFLVAFGWLTGLIFAKLYKIVPFLTWIETYGPVMGKAPTPRVQDLVSERRASKWFAMFFAAAWSATAMLLLEAPLGFRVAAFGMTMATLGMVLELVRARRLVDVAETRRLPAGATAPKLLFSRN
jgi:hypothetical protein